MRRLVLLLSVLTAQTAYAAPVAAPHLTTQSFDALAQPLPLPYDSRANAKAAIAAARARAIANGKLLLIDLGGNWCPDCRVLAGTMALPDLHAFIEKHYDVVMVDIGRYDHNMDVPAHYGLGRPAGVPAIIIVNPKTDAVLNAGHTTALSDARNMSPQALADWLASWTR